MFSKKELEEYFNTSLDELLESNEIIFVASDLDSAFEDYCGFEFEMSFNESDTRDYLECIRDDFYKWLETKISVEDYFMYELDTYKRHFRLDNGNIYYLNNYI